MKIFKQITAWSLLAVLLCSIFPLESFHHHEEHSLVCTDSKTHVEENQFECELADFVFPVFTQNEGPFFLFVQKIDNEFFASNSNVELDLRITNLKTRGPPTTAFLG